MNIYLLVVVVAITWHQSLGLPSPILYLGTELVDVKICKHKQPSVGYLDCLGANSDKGFENLRLTLNSCSKGHADSRQHLDKFIKDLCDGDQDHRGYILQDLSSCFGWLNGDQGSPPRKEPILSTANAGKKCVRTLYKAVWKDTGKEIKKND